MRLFILCIVIHLAVPSLAQIDLPYQHKGSCEIYKVYLDSNLNMCSKNVAKYFVYSLENEGKDVWLNALVKKNKWRNKKWHLTDTISHDSITALSATIRWYYRKQCIHEEYYQEGHAVGVHRVWDRHGSLLQADDFDKTTDGQSWSCYIEKYHRNELIHGEYVQWDFVACRWKVICTFGCMQHPSTVIAP